MFADTVSPQWDPPVEEHKSDSILDLPVGQSQAGGGRLLAPVLTLKRVLVLRHFILAFPREIGEVRPRKTRVGEGRAKPKKPKKPEKNRNFRLALS